MIISVLPKSVRRISIVLILLTFILSTKSLAQTACTATLDQARTVFDDGRIHELEGLMETCLVSGFSPAEKTEALRLLILAHIYLEEPDKSDARMLELLRHDHEYQVNAALDPTEFINLHKTFKTKPIFSIGIKLGVNNVIINPTEVNGTYNLLGERHEYSSLMGIKGGISFEYQLNDFLTLNPELFFVTQKFEKSTDIAESIFAGSNVTTKSLIEEDQTWFQLPVSVQYKITESLVNPYVSAGFSLDFLSSSETAGDASKVTVTRQDGALPEQIVSKISLTEVIDERNKLNLSAFIGAGVKLRLGEGYLDAHLRFNYGITKPVKDGVAYNSVKLWELQDPNDTFKQHVISLTLGYVLDFYKPKKLTSKQLNKKLN